MLMSRAREEWVDVKTAVQADIHARMTRVVSKMPGRKAAAPAQATA